MEVGQGPNWGCSVKRKNSDEHGERFHRVIAAMEKKYGGKWSSAILVDYCWTVTRDVPELVYK
jgi:hypothetical protein